MLTLNLVPFWSQRAVDAEHGGYLLNHDAHGVCKGPAPKSIVTQARTLWFFSKLLRSSFGDLRFAAPAMHGFAFLRDRMWDCVNGGFFWQVDSHGTNPTMPHKHLYGQAFALYALSEYVMATSDRSGQRLLRRHFETVDRSMHDPKNGGYIEFLTRDWSRPPSTMPSYVDAVSPGVKLLNTHVHALEALLAYYEATRDPLARDRLVELVLILSQTAMHRSHPACGDRFASDWTPILGLSGARVSFGHDLETMWLLAETCRAVKLSTSLVLDLYRSVFEHSTLYGVDAAAGGFYQAGPAGRRADQRSKIWWVQAEAMTSALYLHVLTGDPRYFAIFHKTLGWIDRYQVDWERGEWHACIDERGRSSGDKADRWKCPYHTTRAVLTCLDLLTPLRDS
jgi:mannobiose 2-epimerase